jgi:Protein of unknown function (DUF1517)
MRSGLAAVFLAIWSVQLVQSFPGYFLSRRQGGVAFESARDSSHHPRHRPSLPRGPTPGTTRRSMFNKMFEESGPLGKGITVGKVQVALQCRDRNPKTSIFGLLEEKTKNSGSFSSNQLARLGNDVCLALLRKSDDWVAACSSSKWFSQNDQGKAESYFNDLANREAYKFEKVRLCATLPIVMTCESDRCSNRPAALQGVHSRGRRYGGRRCDVGSRQSGS